MRKPACRNLDVLINEAVSLGHCNTCPESILRSLKPKSLSRTLIQSQRFLVQICLRIDRQVRSLGKISSQQPIRLFVTAVLAVRTRPPASHRVQWLPGATILLDTRNESVCEDSGLRARPLWVRAPGLRRHAGRRILSAFAMVRFLQRASST